MRIRAANAAEVREEGDYVLYWMTMSRRRGFNYALQRASLVAAKLERPLVIFEPLRLGYRWASDRFHRFLMEGMTDNARAFAGASVTYFPWLEQSKGQGKGLLEAWSQRSCLVVTDDYPSFFLPRMIAAAAQTLDVRLEVVDSNGVFPMRAASKTWARAHDFRRHLQKALPEHLEPEALPTPDPLDGLTLPSLPEIPSAVAAQWSAITVDELDAPETLAALPIDHDVPASRWQGGETAARAQLETFLGRGLELYADGRNHPDEELSSGLSPWLHFGHIAAHEVFSSVVGEGWTPAQLGPPTGKREGWWKLSPGREAFLDELVTWRELGFNMAHREPEHESFDALPDWARTTLDEHRQDERPYLYSLESFEGAETHDELWNAAQRQLVREGRIHNYLRMLWGKKIFHWTESPEAAFRIMVELNNKYALDGRDPNSYSGIGWVLGRYDRAWGPEREVFGKIRYMTSDSTRRKMRVNKYLARWAG